MAVMASLLLGVFTTPALAASYRVTASSGLVVRSGPGSNYRSLGALAKNAKVSTIGSSGSWRKIRYNGRNAWVHSRYLKEDNGSSDTGDRPSPPDTADTGSNTEHGNFISTLEGRRTLRKGDKGEDVKALQRALKAAGYDVDVDGDYGPQTERAVKAFQRDNGLTRDGVAGPNTLAKLADPNHNGNTATDGTNGDTGGGTDSGSIPENLPRSSAGFVQLPASGTGFYGYYGANRRWGTPTMVYGLMRIGQAWSGNGGRMGVGDISFKNGGKISGHASHRKGVDADIRPMRKDNAESPVTINQSAYSRSQTTKLLRLFRQKLPVHLIFFNDSHCPGVQHWPNHDNHFHVRTTR